MLLPLLDPCRRSGAAFKGLVLTQDNSAITFYDDLREPCYRPILALALYDGAHIGTTLPLAVQHLLYFAPQTVQHQAK